MTLIKMQDFLNRSVGWDGVFQDFNRNASNFPPYSISSNEDGSSNIEIALAGYSKEDVNVSLQDSVLSISSEGTEKPNNKNYTYKGIANRKFVTKFAIGKYHEVQDATMENGMLVVKVAEVIPEEKKVKSITIN